MTSVTGIRANSTSGTLRAALAASPTPRDERLDVGQTFQDFVAGTFYKQMLKALRSTQGKPAYFHGGQAEEIFQGQMDQQIAEDLARDHGAEFARPMFTTFAAHLRSKLQQQGTTPAPAAGL